MAVNVKINVFWDVTPCSLIGTNITGTPAVSAGPEGFGFQVLLLPLTDFAISACP
jgi:hypothetical protein